MPLIEVKMIEQVFTPAQKKELIAMSVRNRETVRQSTNDVREKATKRSVFSGESFGTPFALTPA